MTNEEAINILMHLERYVAEEDGYFLIHAPLMDATLLAIKALRAQQCGSWENSKYGYECTICDRDSLYDNFNRPIKSPFCPNCGARMIKEN